jgi:uncharacterized protein (TIGR00251 family)
LSELKLSRKDAWVEFEVRAKPNAKHSAIVGAREGVLEVRVAARPVDGAANEELLAFLAAKLGVAKRDVGLVQGDSSRNKRVRARGLEDAEVRARLLG